MHKNLHIEKDMHDRYKNKFTRFVYVSIYMA